MKTYLNIFFLFLILFASCGSRKANDNKGTTLQADTVKKFTLPIIKHPGPERKGKSIHPPRPGTAALCPGEVQGLQS